MAECPKCGTHLKLTDWRPECPKCGVNMIYYGMEANLLADAEKAEAEHARFQKRIDRMKASLVGGPLQIARIAFGLIPVAGLFLTLASVNLREAPYIAAKTVNVNILTIVDYISNILDVNGLLAAFSSSIIGTPMIMFAVSLVCLLLSVVLGLFGFFRLICSAQKKSCVKNVVISCLQIVLTVAAVITFTRFSSGINNVFPSLVSASVGFGVWVYLALHLPTMAANIIFAKKPMEVKYTEIPDYSAEDAAAIEAEKALEGQA